MCERAGHVNVLAMCANYSLRRSGILPLLLPAAQCHKLENGLEKKKKKKPQKKGNLFCDWGKQVLRPSGNVCGKMLRHTCCLTGRCWVLLWSRLVSVWTQHLGPATTASRPRAMYRRRFGDVRLSQGCESLKAARASWGLHSLRPCDKHTDHAGRSALGEPAIVTGPRLRPLQPKTQPEHHTAPACPAIMPCHLATCMCAWCHCPEGCLAACVANLAELGMHHHVQPPLTPLQQAYNQAYYCLPESQFLGPQDCVCPAGSLGGRHRSAASQWTR